METRPPSQVDASSVVPVSSSVSSVSSVSPARARGRLRGRAATMVEYALVLSAVVVPSIAGVSLAGAKLFRDYRTTRDHVVRSTP